MNLRTVKPWCLYRSDQPNLEAFDALSQTAPSLGFCVLSLRKDGEEGYSLDRERVAVLACQRSVQFASIPIGGLPIDAPTKAQVQQAVALLRDGRTWLVHCQRGCDRTGVIVACYRILVNGWSKQKAIDEAMACGMSRWQFRMHDFLEDFTS